jgi:hypothetical protein
MNYSRYVIYVPYTVAWRVMRLFRRLLGRPRTLVFYCGNVLDYIVMREVIGRFPRARVIAKRRRVRRVLRERYGVSDCGLYPAFPDVVVMARHVARKFPGKGIRRIGMRHGAYHFKDFVSARRYNAFHAYMVTSRREVELAEREGIRSAVAVGFPKLDPAFDGTITRDDLAALAERLGLDDRRPTVVMTATWERSRMSAVDRWIDRLDEIASSWNVLVTLHPWVRGECAERARRTPGVHYIEDRDVLPYLMLADVMVGDMSSILAEFCALDRPLVTFRVTEGTRLSPEVQRMLAEISLQVEDFDGMMGAMERSVQDPGELSPARRRWNRLMFDRLDGRAAGRAAAVIGEYLE